MNVTLQAICMIATIALLLAFIHVPLGTWMYRCFTDERDWAPERLIYRAVGVDPRIEQGWRTYAVASVMFGVASVVLLFALIMAQGVLPWGLGRSQDWHTAFNTAVSFTTNTNWQTYGGESGAGYTVQMAGLTVQNFVSAATGIAVAVALCRAIARSNAATIGNFWVDLVRSCTRILLPIAFVGALVLVAGGVIQNLSSPHDVTTLVGGSQTIQGGPVASQEVIKLLGTNGGGFFNANSAHPFENPNAWTNLFEILLVLAIPFSLPWMYGLMVGDRRQGAVFTTAMGALFTLSAGLGIWAETRGSLGSMEGKEQRFGIVGSVLFGTATTGTSTGGVNMMHDSMSPLGGGLMMLNMMLGEVSPGGVGTGLYNIIIFALLTVFIAGLMVGRTPELLGKAIGRREITYSALAVVVMPALVLMFTAAGVVLPVAKDAMLNHGPHGLSEMMYAYTSASNNNGSAFAGLSADQPYLNLTLAACMFLGRFLPIVLVLAVAGALVSQQRRPATAGTMPTHGPVFTSLLVGIIVIVAGLTFFPSLALGPIAEALS